MLGIFFTLVPTLNTLPKIMLCKSIDWFRYDNSLHHKRVYFLVCNFFRKRTVSAEFLTNGPKFLKTFYTKKLYEIIVFCEVIDCICRSSNTEVFLGKGVLKICSKFTGEHPCRSAISIKLQSNSGRLLLQFTFFS